MSEGKILVLVACGRSKRIRDRRGRRSCRSCRGRCGGSRLIHARLRLSLSVRIRISSGQSRTSSLLQLTGSISVEIGEPSAVELTALHINLHNIILTYLECQGIGTVAEYGEHHFAGIGPRCLHHPFLFLPVVAGS